MAIVIGWVSAAISCGLPGTASCGDEAADREGALRAALALCENSSRDSSATRVAAFLGLETQHLERRGAAGDGQVKKAGDGGPLVGDEQQDQRRNRTRIKATTYTFKPFAASQPVKVQHELR